METPISKTLLCKAGASISLTLPASMAGEIIGIGGPLTLTRGASVYNNSNYSGVTLSAGDTVLIQCPAGGADGYLVIQEDVETTGGVAWGSLTDVPTDLAGFGLLEEVTGLVTTGEAGPPGASAYDIAVENGFEGTESEWLESLIGPEGPSGGGTSDQPPISFDFASNTTITRRVDRDYTINGAWTHGTGAVAYTKNGITVSLPFSLVAGDLLGVTSSGVSGGYSVILSPVSESSTSNILFSDNFDRGSLGSDYSILTGSPTMTGTAVSTSVSATQLKLLDADTTSLSNGTAIIMGTKGSAINIRMGDSFTTRYFLQWQTDGQVNAYRAISGAYTLIGGTWLTDTSNGAKELKIIFSGSTLKFYFDGVLQDTVIDNNLTTGAVGLQLISAGGETGSIDSVLVTDAIV